MKGRVKAFIEEHRMLEPGSRVVVGVSGGPDSLCLLDILCGLRKEWQLEVSAVHVHHGLRGVSADRDEAFVKAFCQERQVVCRVFHEQVEILAKEQKKSIEEAGRDIRYLRFEQWRSRWNGNRIAVAHHQDDQAETMLFQLARGSGLRGAGGIRPVNGRVIRPLLCAGRREIERYLTERKIAWCEDETNAGADYARNCIRRQILPLLAENINSRTSAHLAAAALEFQEAEAYVAEEERRLYGKYVEELSEGMAVSDGLLDEASFMRRRVLYSVLRKVSGSARDLSAIHVKVLENIFSGSCGRQGDLPYGVRVWKEKGRLLAVRPDPVDIRESAAARSDRAGDMPSAAVFRNRTDGKTVSACIPLTVPGTFVVDGRRLTLRILQENPANYARKKYTKWLDCDKISGSLVLRRRRPGDRITIDSAGHHKKLKDYLIDRKIPRHKRDSLWLVADDREVLWIIGERMGAVCGITGTTRRILEIECTGDERYE